jgi:vacuolar-type H+-ATPase subunit E/Vma4
VIPTFDAALSPVRSALAEHARREGAQALADADAAVAAEQTATAAEAERILDRARAAGAADAAAFAAGERARTDREARELVLQARREEYDSLRDAARVAAAALRLAPDYARLRWALIACVRALLGPEAVIIDAADGGVVGSVPGRRVDLSLGTFADRAVETVLSANPSLVDGGG